MKITKENLVEYLITQQLIIAGYQITYDEIIEQFEAYQHSNPEWRWFTEYSQTQEQQKQWFKECNKIVRKVLHCSKAKAAKELMWLDLSMGLTIKL